MQKKRFYYSSVVAKYKDQKVSMVEIDILFSKKNIVRLNYRRMVAGILLI